MEVLTTGLRGQRETPRTRREIPPEKRLDGDNRPEADFFCAGCGGRARGHYAPQGWFSVMQHSGSRQPAYRVGLYCSAACLETWAAKVADLGAPGVD